MEAPTAICPHCKNDVRFIEEAGTKRCPSCGFQFPLSVPPPVSSYSKSKSPAREFLVALLKAVAVVVGLGIFLLGILYAGCIWIAKGGHF
jgi:predicted amidophosphoribosyltransferase